MHHACSLVAGAGITQDALIIILFIKGQNTCLLSDKEGMQGTAPSRATDNPPHKTFYQPNLVTKDMVQVPYVGTGFYFLGS